MPNISDAIRLAVPTLTDAGVETPRLDAQLIVAWICKLRREEIAAHPERELTERELAIFRKAIQLRAQRRPLPYITGEAWFYGRSFKVNRAVLVPRPETELLVDFAKYVTKIAQDPNIRIADIGTGSGCVAVTIAAEISDASVVAVDISRLALLVAAKNCKRHGVVERVELREGDLCAPLGGDRFDLIVSNPPYIDVSEAPTLMPEVRDYEPPLALYGVEELSKTVTSPRLIRQRLMSEARTYLVPGGWLTIEIGAGQVSEAVEDAKRLGYADVDTITDHAGIDRVVVGQYPH